MIHKDPSFTIFFGDIRNQFMPSMFAGSILESQESFKPVIKLAECEGLLFLHQVHGNQGLAIDAWDMAKPIPSFALEGDFLITNISGLGLGVATADCLPIVLYDRFSHSAAIVHAGWRGSCKQVVGAALERMEARFNTQPDSVKVFFGPAAKSCCYEVGEDVLNHLEQFSYGFEVVQKIGDSWRLDVARLNQLQLQELGVPKNAFHGSYNICTICNQSFCSYRRQKGASYRQMTVVTLK